MISSYLLPDGAIYLLAKAMVLALVLLVWFTVKSYPVT